MDVIELWWLWTLIGAVVVVVVAVLLGLIIATAKSIDRHAVAIWTTGKQIAGNTAAIWQMDKLSKMARMTHDSAEAIARSTEAMNDKLRALAEAPPGRGR